MESPESRTFAQFGGLLILVSLALPWFALSLAGFGAEQFRIWRLDKGAFVLVAAYGLLALAQVKLSSRDAMAMSYLVVSGLMTAAFIYKIWISPPGSAPLGGISGIDGTSMKDALASIGIEMKASYGAYVALVGSVLFTVGAFLEFRAAGEAKGVVAAPAQTYQQQPVAPGQRYQAPAPQTSLAQAAPQQIPPDPFAPPQPPSA